MTPASKSDNSFQSLILKLQSFWAERGCVILQPYDMEVGAGTFHPATALRALGPETWNAAYVQPSRRPADGRYGDNPNRLQHYYQFQVVLKPSPDDVQELYLESLRVLGITPDQHDIRQVFPQQVVHQIGGEDREVDIRRHQVGALAQPGLGRGGHPVAAGPERPGHPLPAPAAMPGAVQQHEGLAFCRHGRSPAW